MMTERFNVSGALLVKLFGRPETESDAFAAAPGGSATSASRSAMYSRVVMTVARPAGLARHRARLRRRRRDGDRRLARHRHARRPDRLPRPALRPAHVAVERAGRRHDHARQLRAGARGARPRADDRRRRRRRTPLPAGPVAVELDDVRFRYPTAAEVSLASLEGVARLEETVPAEVLHGVSLRVEPGRTLALVGPSGAGKSTIAGLVSRLYDPTDGAVRIGGVDLRDTTLADVRDTVGVVAQDVHLFHDTLARQPALRQARRHRRRARGGPAGGRRSGTSSPGCPTASTPSSATAATACRAARSSASPSPGCCSRTRASWSSTRRRPTSTPARKPPSRPRSATALAGRTSIVIAHRLATVRAADEIAVIDGGRVVERGTHDELVAAGGLYADLSRTQFADAPLLAA